MPIKAIFILLLLLFSTFHSKAAFNFSANCREAYTAIFDLRLQEARTWIQREKTQNSTNGIIILLENYIDFFELWASDNQKDYERLKNRKSERISALEKQDQSSPFYLFAQAEINLQWGLLHSRFSDYFASAMDIRKADKLLGRNASAFPDFLPNEKSSGLINVIFGAIPANLKGITSTFGFKGNTTNGIKTLENLTTTLPASNYAFYTKEVVFFLCYIETDLIHHQSNYNKMLGHIGVLENTSLLKTYLQGYISVKYAQNDQAIDYLEKRPKGTGYISFPALDYLLGNAKLNRMDTDANLYLARFIKDSKGVHFIKDAYLKMAYYYYLKGDNHLYNAFLALVKTKGNTLDEKDKQALKEANEPPPDKALLKARFYFDGGYYDKALAQLAGKSTADFRHHREQIELHYRLGRIYDALGNDAKAITHYKEAFELGRQASYYYAANAALNMGKIYEKRNDLTQAGTAYNQAISLKNHEYENSIENQAKAALKRMGK